MITIDYDSIFSCFLGNMTDYGLAQDDNDIANLRMTEWLHKACSKPFLNNMFVTLTLSDDIQTVEFEMTNPIDKTDESKDIDYICDVIAKGMLVEWLRPQVNTFETIKQFFGGSEQKYYSQANHLSELRGLYKDVKDEFDTLIRDRGAVHNDYLEET